MFTVLFTDSSYENFDYNIVDNSSIIFTKCFDQEFLDTFYIKGIKTIYLYKNFDELGPLGIDIDIIVTGSNSEIYKDFNGVIYNYKDNTVIDDIGKSAPVSFKMLSNILKYLPESNDIVRCNTESYENLLQFIDRNIETNINSPVDEQPQDKFQKTMQKEASKLIYAENRERYKLSMRQSSLSNKKSIQKDETYLNVPGVKKATKESKATKATKEPKATKTAKPLKVDKIK
jgi:hypothetical protein